MNSPTTSPTLPKDETSPPTNGDQLGTSTPHPKMPHQPRSARRSKKFRLWLLLLVAVLIVGGVAGWVFFKGMYSHNSYYYGLTDFVKKEKMRIQIVEKGELESAENNDIKVPVKTNAANKNNSIKIKWVIDDGTSVKKGQDLEQLCTSVVGQCASGLGAGPLLCAAALYPERRGDLLVTIDPTPLEDDLTTEQNNLDTAQAESIKAEQDLLITRTENEATIKKAEVDWKVAKLNYQKYLEGDYKVTQNSKKKEIMDAESDLKQWQDRAAWSQRMVFFKYLSESQSISDEAKRMSSEILLGNLQNELKVITTITDQKNRIEMQGAIDKCKLDLDKAVAQATSKEVQAEAARKNKRSLYLQELAKNQDIQDQIAWCNIYAPRDGMVVYYISTQSKFGLGSSQNIIASGEPVVYDQKLMQIPDLAKMQVRARIHEAMVKYLKNEEYDENGLSQHVFQKAVIRVEAYPDRLFQAHVRTVAAVASKQDFMSSDVRVYETVLTIDEVLKGKEVKPGMSAEVTILAYESPQPVITIPMQAVVGSITMGKERKCFVVHDNGLAEEREIKIGLSNERVVEVLSGLKEGEKVALDPSILLPPDSAMHAAKPGKGQEQVDGEGGKKGSGKFRQGGAGGMPPGGMPPGGMPPGGGKGFPGAKGPAAGANSGPSAALRDQDPNQTTSPIVQQGPSPAHRREGLPASRS